MKEASGNVQITESGRVNGNIKTDSLIIEKGGIFSGNVVRISSDDEKKNDVKNVVESSISYSDNVKEEVTEPEYEAQEEKEEEDTLEL